MNKTFIFFSLFFSCTVLAQNWEYFTKRTLSKNNINVLFGVSLLNPPNSFRNSFFKDLIVQMDYRKEGKSSFWPPPFFFRTQWIQHSKGISHSVGLFPGLRWPKTHRKTPLYFSISIGTLLSSRKKQKISFYMQFSGVFRWIQWTRKISGLIELSARYRLDQANTWRTPSSIMLLTGLDLNI